MLGRKSTPSALTILHSVRKFGTLLQYIQTLLFYFFKLNHIHNIVIIFYNFIIGTQIKEIYGISILLNFTPLKSPQGDNPKKTIYLVKNSKYFLVKLYSKTACKYSSSFCCCRVSDCNKSVVFSKPSLKRLALIL